MSGFVRPQCEYVNLKAWTTDMISSFSLLFPVHWLCLNQTFNNLISQAGQMVNSGVPNDTIKSPNPIASIILTPVASKGLYPFLTRRRIRFGPTARIAMGFLFLTLAKGLHRDPAEISLLHGPLLRPSPEVPGVRSWPDSQSNLHVPCKHQSTSSVQLRKSSVSPRGQNTPTTKPQRR